MDSGYRECDISGSVGGEIWTITTPLVGLTNVVEERDRKWVGLFAPANAVRMSVE